MQLHQHTGAGDESCKIAAFKNFFVISLCRTKQLQNKGKEALKWSLNVLTWFCQVNIQQLLSCSPSYIICTHWEDSETALPKNFDNL